MIEVKINDAKLQHAAEAGMDEFVKAFVDAIREAIGGELTAETMAQLNSDQITLLAWDILHEDALLKHFVKKYEQMPVLQMEEIGYGFGKREYERLNCVRAILGETQDKVEEEILELCCNLDDMTSEEIGYATELLIKEGALDVYTSSIQMKKNRPGILLTCMCRAEQKEYFLQLIFKHTSTLGVREYFCRRYGLKRKIDEVQTEYGTVHVKRASGYGVVKEKLEYDDVSKIAEEHSWSVAEARNRIYGKL